MDTAQTYYMEKDSQFWEMKVADKNTMIRCKFFLAQLRSSSTHFVVMYCMYISVGIIFSLLPAETSGSFLARVSDLQKNLFTYSLNNVDMHYFPM